MFRVIDFDLNDLMNVIAMNYSRGIYARACETGYQIDTFKLVVNKQIMWCEHAFSPANINGIECI